MFCGIPPLGRLLFFLLSLQLLQEGLQILILVFLLLFDRRHFHLLIPLRLRIPEEFLLGEFHHLMLLVVLLSIDRFGCEVLVESDLLLLVNVCHGHICHSCEERMFQ